MPEESLELRRGSSNRKLSYRGSSVFLIKKRNTHTKTRSQKAKKTKGERQISEKI